MNASTLSSVAGGGSAGFVTMATPVPPKLTPVARIAFEAQNWLHCAVCVRGVRHFKGGVLLSKCGVFACKPCFERFTKARPDKRCVALKCQRADCGTQPLQPQKTPASALHCFQLPDRLHKMHCDELRRTLSFQAKQFASLHTGLRRHCANGSKRLKKAQDESRQCTQAIEHIRNEQNQLKNKLKALRKEAKALRVRAEKERKARRRMRKARRFERQNIMTSPYSAVSMMTTPNMRRRPSRPVITPIATKRKSSPHADMPARRHRRASRRRERSSQEMHEERQRRAFYSPAQVLPLRAPSFRNVLTSTPIVDGPDLFAGARRLESRAPDRHRAPDKRRAPSKPYHPPLSQDSIVFMGAGPRHF